MLPYKYIFLIVKINVFWGDLRNVLAKATTLACRLPCTIGPFSSVQALYAWYQWLQALLRIWRPRARRYPCICARSSSCCRSYPSSNWTRIPGAHSTAKQTSKAFFKIEFDVSSDAFILYINYLIWKNSFRGDPTNISVKPDSLMQTAAQETAACVCKCAWNLFASV